MKDEKYIIKDPLQEGKKFVPLDEKIRLNAIVNQKKQFNRINPCLERLEKLLE